MSKKLVIAIIIIFCGKIFAQYGGSSSSSQGFEQSIQFGSPSSAIKQDALPRDYSGTNLFIDENAYYLGSGDVLRAVIWGVSETVLDIPVVDEICIIPTVGALDAGFITLKDAREKIISMIKKKYKTERIDVFLANVKEISAQIQGQVNNPNTHTIQGNLSISSIIEQAGGTKDGANLREIQLIHPKHGTRIVDIMKMNRDAGYPAANLRNGDRIFVPIRDLRISINGDVQYSGDYDFVAGDKLSDLIKLSGGMLSTADSSRIIITRFIGQRDSINKITLTADEIDDFALEKDDMVFVSRKSEYRPVRQVKISGEVSFPGTYSIQENKTRLIDLIEQAGGLTEHAFLGGSKIVRKNFIDVAGNEQKRLQSASEKLQITPIENNFLKYRKNDETQVSIDFAQLKMDKNSIENVMLREDDEIFIEKNDFMINVMGAVVRPGLVEFSQGKDLSFYLEKTGGYKTNAVPKKVKIIKSGSEVWLKPRQVKNIEQGDAVWIPERDYVERQERQQDVAIRSSVVGIVGSIATTITAAITVMMFIEGR